MIQKNLFFIWFGERPKYVEYCISNFSNANPDFNIKRYLYQDVYNTGNQDIEECIAACKRKNTFYHSWVNRLYYKNVCLCENAKWSDVLRWYLLEKYGGIYLDCDTWPVKPFDDELLNRDSFFVTRMENYFYRDSFFMGFKRGFLGNKFINTTYINFNGSQFDIKQSENKFTDKIRVKLCNNIFNYSVPSLIDSKLYSIDKNKFLSGRLNKFEHYLNQSNLIEQRSFIENYYIDHYFIKSWE